MLNRTTDGLRNAVVCALAPCWDTRYGRCFCLVVRSVYGLKAAEGVDAKSIFSSSERLLLQVS